MTAVGGPAATRSPDFAAFDALVEARLPAVDRGARRVPRDPVRGRRHRRPPRGRGLDRGAPPRGRRDGRDPRARRRAAARRRGAGRRTADPDRASSTTTSSRRRRSSCGPTRRTSRSSATAGSGPAARPTTRASSCRASGRSRPIATRSARSRAASGSSSRARRRRGATRSTPCSTCGRRLRDADAALIEGGGLDLDGRPGVVGGGKGIVVFELVCRTLAHDAHSSLSVVLPNAGHRLVRGPRDVLGRGRAAGDRGLDVGQAAADAGAARHARGDGHDGARRHPRGVGRPGVPRRARRRRGAGGAHVRDDAQPPGPVGRATPRPTPKTVTPAEAHARLDIRIVPDQRPDAIVAAVRRHLDEHGFADIEIVVREGEPAWWTPPDHVVVTTAARVSEAVAGHGGEHRRVDGRHRADGAGLRAAPGPCDVARRGPRRLPGARAGREHPARRPRGRDAG